MDQNNDFIFGKLKNKFLISIILTDDKRYAVREAENAYKEAEQLVTIFAIKKKKCVITAYLLLVISSLLT